MNYQVLIVGGGVAGLTLALKLVQRKIDVLLVEKDAGQSILYKGELLQPKSVEILYSLGLNEELEAESESINEIRSLEVDTFEDSPPTFRGGSSLSYSILASPYNKAKMIPHEKLRDLLFEKLNQHDTFHHLRPARFLGFTSETNLFKQKARIKTKDGEELIVADFYIGAEGRASSVRKHMNVTLKETNYNHQFLTVSFPKPPGLRESVMYSSQHSFLGLFPLPNNEVRSVLLIQPGEWKAMKEEGLESFFEAYKRFMPEMEGYVDQLRSWREIQLMIPVRHNASAYVDRNRVIIGDAAHSVHPMAGEGMNLAIQDGDVLGELLAWMYEKGELGLENLQWFERVRKPRAEYLSRLSHQSALAYSLTHPIWRKLRLRALYYMEHNPKIHFKQMLNVSGLGLWKATIFDYMKHLGFPPGLTSSKPYPAAKQRKYLFTPIDDYPWYAQTK
ncbi:FAD-dependent oxidoreductase [Salsuginibacillus kocurii]|uniref:FAD-dependent oxidoreductase n=1 Tax=Salsuginibacillus kocurii TaxID=427078 RepID=UPI00037D862C|nr:NAD(P)/FAD-dependent oxidoreductase [Salsuginibacillus kocurii]